MTLLEILLGVIAYFIALWTVSLVYILSMVGWDELRDWPLVTVLGLAPVFALLLSAHLSMQKEVEEAIEA